MSRHPHPSDRHPTRKPSTRQPVTVLGAVSALLLTGCQTLATPSTTAHIRIVDASPDAPTLDIYQRTAALTYNLSFANITSYIEATPGPGDLSIVRSGSHQILSALQETLAPADQYTLLVGGTANTLQSVLLRDRSTPAPTGQVAVRFLDKITAEAAFDIYLVPSGSSVTSAEPILLNQAFDANSGYLILPAAAYRIVLYPAGTEPSASSHPAYSGPTAVYPSGAARTILLLDQNNTSKPAFQSITTHDFDPVPGAN